MSVVLFCYILDAMLCYVVSYCSGTFSAGPRLLGALRETVSPAGGVLRNG